MFFAEKWINHVLWYRTSPDGEWLPAHDKQVIAHLERTNHEILEAAAAFFDAQAALDNRELQGINAESYGTLLRRRNDARAVLDDVLHVQNARGEA